MMNLEKPIFVVRIIACLMLSSFFLGSANAQDRPNVLFILTDDVGLGDIRSYNPDSKVSLPTIELLANEGMRFTDAHTSAAKCAPSRYSIISGNYQWRGTRNWGQWQYRGGSQIRSGQLTLGNIMQQAGYKTAFVGKHHLGGEFYAKNSDNFVTSNAPEIEVDFSRQFRSGPLEGGFDASFLALRGIQASPYAFFENDTFLGNPENVINWEVGDYGDTRIVEAGLGLPDWNTREVGPTILEKAIDFIGAHHQANISTGSNTPFFLYFNTESVHGPYKPPITIRGTPVLGTSGLSARGDMLREIDLMLKVIQEELSSRGLLDDTLIILTSDNGASRVGNETFLGHDAPGYFRGDKGTIFEGGHRVPLIIKWGDGSNNGSPVAPGSVNDALIGIQDLFTSLARLTGVSTAEDQGRDSFNMLPTILGYVGGNLRDHMIHEADEDESLGRVSRHFAIREGDWKLILDDEDNPEFLFNLVNDSAESRNLVADANQADRVNQMLARFNMLMSAERSAPVLSAPTIVINSPSDGSTHIEGEVVTFEGTATDSDDGDLSASILWTSDVDGEIGVGASVSIDELTPGAHVIFALVTDSDSFDAAAEIGITVNAPLNRAPVALPIPNGAATEGRFFSQAMAPFFADPDDDALTYRASGLPSSLTIDIGTGVVSGTPRSADVQSAPYIAMISAVDPLGEIAEAEFSILVSKAPEPVVQQSGGGGSFAGMAVLIFVYLVLRNLTKCCWHWTPPYFDRTGCVHRGQKYVDWQGLDGDTPMTSRRWLHRTK
jgi:arylsulfatase A-like enzyme